MNKKLSTALNEQHLCIFSKFKIFNFDKISNTTPYHDKASTVFYRCFTITHCCISLLTSSLHTDNDLNQKF